MEVGDRTFHLKITESPFRAGRRGNRAICVASDYCDSLDGLSRRYRNLRRIFRRLGRWCRAVNGVVNRRTICRIRDCDVLSRCESAVPQE